MKYSVNYLAAFMTALVIGLSSALWSINLITERTGVKNGPWFTNLTIGSRQCNPYLKAQVALKGLFALHKSESIYYLANCDEDGQPLNSSYDYRIEGEDLDARWWSITVYGEDLFLIPDGQCRYSYNRTNVTCNADGKYTIYLSATFKNGNWLPTGDEKQLYLTLRLYNPGMTVFQNPASINLPRIVREEG